MTRPKSDASTEPTSGVTAPEAKPNAVPGPAPSRRELMSKAAIAALGAAGLALGAGAVAVMLPRRAGMRRIALATPQVAVGSMVFFADHGLFVVRTPEGLGVLSAKCTHLGCMVRQSGSALLCPCHGARYDQRGRVVSGPAKRDLPWLAVELRPDGVLLVDAGREVPSGTVAALADARSAEPSP